MNESKQRGITAVKAVVLENYLLMLTKYDFSLTIRCYLSVFANNKTPGRKHSAF